MDQETPLFPPAAARPHDVLCVGTALVDLLAHASVEAVAALGLNPGGMTLVDDQAATAIRAALGIERAVSGGTVANTAAGIAALGGSPAYLGAVGADELGARFATDLEEAGVRAVLEVREGQGSGSGACHVIVTPDAQRTMATNLGVSGQLSARFVAESGLVAEARFVYFDGYLLDFPDASALVTTLLEEARGAESRVAFGLADPFAVGRHLETMRTLVGEVDLVFCNEEEAMALSGAAALPEALDFLTHPERVSVVTRGPLGAVVVTAQGRVEVDAVPVPEVRDVTGAGDLFAAGVLFAAARGDGPRRAAALGATLAAEAISHLGARPEVDLADLVTRADLA
ncbi:MAG TPA: adenosine kinase [Acidimicrobiales bacterium]|nr:adenosine kinase [Acidimicrobiales bacterium]